MGMQNYTWKETNDQTQISMKLGPKEFATQSHNCLCPMRSFCSVSDFCYKNHLLGGCISKRVCYAKGGGMFVLLGGCISKKVCYAKGGGMFVGEECNWACIKRWARFLHSLGQANFLVSNEFHLLILEAWFVTVILSTFHHGLVQGHSKWIGCILCMFNWQQNNLGGWVSNCVIIFAFMKNICEYILEVVVSRLLKSFNNVEGGSNIGSLKVDLFWEEFCENQPKKLTWDRSMLPLIGTLGNECIFPCLLVWTSMMWYFRQVTKS